ncbi:MAG: twin-arginine translocation signal domain-containing protein, partial [Pirellulaceae bacterium]
MNRRRSDRRLFLKQSAAAAGLAATPYFFTTASAQSGRSPSDRPVLGCIGTGDRWKQIVGGALKFADGAAVCDVDADHMAEG